MLDFRADQAIHLSEAKTMVETRDFRLIGPMVTSQSAEGRNFFIGANYYYILAAIGLPFSWDPLAVTTVFIFIEMAFFIVFILFLKQKVGSSTSLLLYWFIAVSPYLVAHSRFFWNPHLLIPLSIVTIISLEKYIDTHKYVFLTLASFFWGFAFSSHYIAILWLPIFMFFLAKSSQLKNTKSWIIIISSFIVGDLPFFIFELRNQFYNLKTFLLVYTQPNNSSGFTLHYLVFPFLVFIIYFLLTSFPRRQLFLLGMFTSITFAQFWLFPKYPSFGAIAGWDYPTQQKTADFISNNCTKSFNIAATMQGDTRFYDLRFLLAQRGCKVDAVNDYSSSKHLILVSPYTRSLDDEKVWEVDSLRPFVINSKVELNGFLDLYSLSRI